MDHDSQGEELAGIVTELLRQILGRVEHKCDGIRGLANDLLHAECVETAVGQGR